MLGIDRLHTIKETIELMNKSYQVEILKLLISEESIVISENNNGTFVNLSNLDIKIINKLEKFIEYVKTQQSQLSHIENEKINIKNEFFNKTPQTIKIIKKDNINSILDSK